MEFKCAVAVHLIWSSKVTGGCCKMKKDKQIKPEVNWRKGILCVEMKTAIPGKRFLMQLSPSEECCWLSYTAAADRACHLCRASGNGVCGCLVPRRDVLLSSPPHLPQNQPLPATRHCLPAPRLRELQTWAWLHLPCSHAPKQKLKRSLLGSAILILEL